jgi:hypothetical protein
MTAQGVRYLLCIIAHLVDSIPEIGQAGLAEIRLLF